MRLPIHQIDAFAERVFSGNPAAVVLLDDWLPDDRLQTIAAENNQATTAFLVRSGGRHALRWFTPTIEEEICGHATLATAWLVLEKLEPGRAAVTFDTRAGALTVARLADGRLEIDFPARPTQPVEPHADLLPALGAAAAREILAARDYLVVFDTADEIRALRPDHARIAALDRHAVIVTAPGDGGYDCISRFFAPGHGIPEDAATGAAHASIAPYWAERLGRPRIRAFQASRRGAVFECTMRGARVAFAGRCIPYMEGTITI
jgi:PhzF family phenazine biosynthesis protein